MITKSTKQVAAILGMHPSRIEQWISREQFLPRIFAEKGLGREWTFDEALRLKLFANLVDVVGMDPKEAGILTQVGVCGFNDDEAYFVAYHDRPDGYLTWLHQIVRKRDLADFIASGCRYPCVLAAGYDAETIAENSRPNFGPAYLAVVVNLDQASEDLKAQWGE